MRLQRAPNAIVDANELREAVEWYSQQPAVAFDVETRPGTGVVCTKPSEYKAAALDPLRNEVFWISLAAGGRADAIPMGHAHGEYTGRWRDAPLKLGAKSTSLRERVMLPPPEQLRPADVASILKPLFFNPDIMKIGHNIKFDLRSWSKYYGELIAPPFADTLVAAHLLDENRPLDLGSLVVSEFRYKYDKIGATVQSKPFSEAARYSRLDAKVTWLLYHRLESRLREEGLYDYYRMLCDVTEVLSAMEWQGIDVVESEVQSTGEFLIKEMDRLAGEIYRYAGKQFALTNRNQQAWYVYEHCEHKPRILTPKKKEPSTADEALRYYTGDPRVARLMEWSDLSKLHTTYIVNFQKYAYRGRLHTSFKQHGTVTGRLSSAEPNLQQVPRPDTEVGKRLRRMFWAGDGNVLLVGDFSQIELRVLAHYSGDATMVAAFENGIDIHQASADRLGCDRSIAKNINFAIPYGAGPSKVWAMGHGAFTLADATKFYHLHQEEFPAVWTFVAKVKYTCLVREPHQVRTLLGRPRRLPNIRGVGPTFEDRKLSRARSERQSVNSIVQGSAADIVQRAMIRLHDSLEPGMHLALQVHDEFVVTCPAERVEQGLAIMHEAMEGSEMQILRVPLTANIVAVDRWADAK